MTDKPNSGRRLLVGGLIGGVGATTGAVKAAGQPTIGPLIRNDDDFEHGVRLSRYGYNGRGNDDTQVWRDAIEEAAARQFRKIIVPAGVSPVGKSIVDGALPAGLSFEGEAPVTSSPGIAGATILHGGIQPCWRIDSRGTDPWGESGGWAWRNLRFLSASLQSTLFDFNDPTRYDPIEQPGDSHGILRGIRFENCYFDFKGAAGRGRTGDGIRAAKVYGLYIDPLCRFGHFRRSIWLHGCDDCVIAAHSIGGQRGIMHETVNTYGSNLLVTTRFFTSPGPRDVEDAYQIWDGGRGTTLLNPSLEDQGHARALLYLNGIRTRVIGARFAGGPLFELGPEARECVVMAPDVAVPNLHWQPIIADPAQYDVGIPTADRRMLVAQSGRDFRAIVGQHPRIVFDGGFPASSEHGGASASSVSYPWSTDGRGCRPAQRLLTPLTDTSASKGTEADAGPSGWVRMTDAGTPGGWAFVLAADVAQAGINWPFVVGEDFMPGDRLRIRARLSCADYQGWVLAIIVNGRWLAGVDLNRIPTSAFHTIERTVDTARLVAGDILRLTIYPATPRKADMLLSFMQVEPLADGPVINLD